MNNYQNIDRIQLQRDLQTPNNNSYLVVIKITKSNDYYPNNLNN